MGERLLCKQEVAGSIPAGSMYAKPDWLEADVSEIEADVSEIERAAAGP
jgi:hypothetical protein